MLTNQLSEYARDNLQKVVKGDLHQFMQLHPEVLVQIKYNGTRVLAISNGDSCRIATKHNGVYGSEDYPELFRELIPKMGNYTVLDCEFLKQDQTLWVFDVLFHKEQDVRAWSLLRRQLLLETIIGPQNKVWMVGSKFCTTEESVLSCFNEIIRSGGEGIVVKDIRAAYGTPGAWLKKRATETIDSVVIAKDPPDERGVEWTYTIALFGPETTIHLGHYITDEKARSIYEPEPKWGWTGRVSSATSEIDRKKIDLGTILEVRFNKFRGQLQFPGTIVRIREDKSPSECTVDQLEGL